MNKWYSDVDSALNGNLFKLINKNVYCNKNVSLLRNIELKKSKFHKQNYLMNQEN